MTRKTGKEKGMCMKRDEGAEGEEKETNKHEKWKKTSKRRETLWKKRETRKKEAFCTYRRATERSACSVHRHTHTYIHIYRLYMDRVYSAQWSSNVWIISNANRVMWAYTKGAENAARHWDGKRKVNIYCIYTRRRGEQEKKRRVNGRKERKRYIENARQYINKNKQKLSTRWQDERDDEKCIYV